MNFYTDKHYKFILSTALKNNWSFKEFNVSEIRKKNKKKCFLRHDCDHNLSVAEKMSEIEYNLGIKSTYFLRFDAPLYNLLCNDYQILVNRILKRGHHIGLHYFYDKTKGPKWNNDKILYFIELLKDKFNKVTNIISFHQPSDLIIENRLKINFDHTYDKNLFSNLNYRSDSNLRMINDGCVSEYFKNEINGIQLLIHPEWWTERKIDLTGKWIKMYEDSFKIAQKNLIRTEDKYNNKLKIKISK